ncbi:MAG: AMP-dependent synthetase and ligase [Firmicutes bacterium]|nr:AMP-dependent synthetase and ligase [Bacillota bacterium]
MRKTPLECWAANKIGIDEAALTREQISRYQMERLKATIQWAWRCSPFYRNLLQGVAEKELTCFDDLRRFPFTDAEDIRRQGLQFLCVSQDDISRAVTLDSSGTTGAVKRLYFESVDQAATVDFFQYGMAALVERGDRVLILLPGERAGSVGTLLATALNNLGAQPIPYGVVRSIPQALEVMYRERIDSLVGSPAEVFALARYAKTVAGKVFRLKNVLLSTDYVPKAIEGELQQLWGCDVFQHYGMTEMGLGGGTDCAAHSGYHLHEADFYFEIIDPLTFEVVPEGQKGEVVVTTLNRRGMPLIRYRTGDISRFIPGKCGCGAVLKRLEQISARKDGQIVLITNQYITMADLDEALFPVDGVISFAAEVDSIKKATKLTITALTVGKSAGRIEHELYFALNKVTAIRLARRAGMLTVQIKNKRCDGTLFPSKAKRAITELKEVDEN